MMQPNFSIDNDGQNPDCKEKLKKLWNLVPLFIRFIIITTIILYLFNLLIPYISLSLSNIPLYTVFYFQIWRLFTTVLTTTGILNILLTLIFWARDAAQLESSMGTIKYLLVFFMNSILIQIIYCIFSGLISLILRNKMYMASKIGPDGKVDNCGLWPVIMCEITLLCMSNPDSQMKFLFFPCHFKAKFYPIIIFAIFCLLNSFVIDFEVLSGIVYGILYHYFLKNRMQISNNFIIKVENSCLCKWMTKLNGFFFCRAEPLKYVPQISQSSPSSSSRSVSIGYGSNNQNNFRPFGGKGYGVGGTIVNNKGDVYSGINENSVNENIPKTNTGLETLESKIKSQDN